MPDSGNKSLNAAAKAKKDEFYTQLADIENELKHYRKHFKGKTILCNCDDPYESNFFKYFVLNFNRLGLKKLIATSYSGSPIAGTQLSLFEDADHPENNTKPYKSVVTGIRDATGNGAIDMSDIKELIRSGEIPVEELKGNGDFRSDECVDLLKEADVVVTNPPFSLFREYVAQLVKYGKQFLIIGNQNAITYKEIFPLIKENKMWLGYHSGHTLFEVPDTYTIPDFYDLNDRTKLRSNGYIIDENGKLWRNLGNICWFTNLDIKKRHEDLILIPSYCVEKYSKYDNYDAIEVPKVADIPRDYSDIMGVPISFLDKYNPDQFEILGETSGRNDFNSLAWPTKRYIEPIQHSQDGKVTNGGKVNTGAELLVKKAPSQGVYYTAQNADGYLVRVFKRILVRNKHPEQPKEQ